MAYIFRWFGCGLKRTGVSGAFFSGLQFQVPKAVAWETPILLTAQTDRRGQHTLHRAPLQAERPETQRSPQSRITNFPLRVTPMLSPADIHRKAQRRYPDYLRAVVRGKEADFFPLDIPGSKGSTRQAFDQLYPALQALLSQAKEQTGRGYSVETHTVNTRHAGAMTMPRRVYFAEEADWLAFLGKKQEVAQFRQALTQTQQQAPELLPWLEAKPQKLLDALAVWGEVLKVLAYFRAHPRPGCYLRELPIAVHTKFIEQHQRLIDEVLSTALPEGHFAADESHFARRYGLRYDEPTLRLRALEAKVLPDLPATLSDLSLPISQANRLTVSAQRIFIVENKQTFLAFPPVEGGLAIWGKGFAVELLRELYWLREPEIWFWGDLDAQGFQMLHQVRRYFAQTQSLLMDAQTYEAFAEFAGAVASPTPMQLTLLTKAEQALYQRLLASPEANRLEQEHISQAWVRQALRCAGVMTR
jgi:hypothetical protein